MVIEYVVQGTILTSQDVSIREASNIKNLSKRAIPRDRDTFAPHLVVVK